MVEQFYRDSGQPGHILQNPRANWPYKLKYINIIYTQAERRREGRETPKSDLETMHVMSIGCPNRVTRGQEDEADCSRGVGVGISLVGLQQGDTF